jgi:hypothetical protein
MRVRYRYLKSSKAAAIDYINEHKQSGTDTDLTIWLIRKLKLSHISINNEGNFEIAKADYAVSRLWLKIPIPIDKYPCMYMPKGFMFTNRFTFRKHNKSEN